MKKKAVIWLRINKIILIALSLGVLFWVIEAAVHVFVFKKGIFVEEIFNPEPHEVWMRVLVAVILFAFAMYARLMIRQRESAEKNINIVCSELNQIFNTASDGMRVIDKDFNVVRVNQTFCLLAGLPKDKILGKKCYEVFRGTNCDSPQCPLICILNGEKFIETDVEKERSDGVKVPCIVTAAPFLGANGEILGIVENFKNIAERKKAIEELQKREERFRTLVSNIPGAVYLRAPDKKWTIEFISDAIKEISGYPASDFTANKMHNYYNLIHEDDRAMVEQIVIDAIERKEPYVLEYRLVHADADIRWVYEKGQGIFDVKGNLVWLNGVIFDISNRKKMEEELKNAMEIKSNFISMVTHELRMPLIAIKEGIGVVLDGVVGSINIDQKDFLETVKRNVDRLARLINDVLDVQKFEAGKMEFDMQENDINEVIEEIYKIMLPYAKEKGLNIILRFEADLPLIKFDRDKIIQVLTNLVDNAVKFTDEGEITISSSQEDNIVEVSVRDTGQGIKEEDMPRLFHEFEQLSKGKNRKTSGTGLGLAISKEIVTKHNGKIWAESVFNKGTTFHFVLPIKERRTQITS